MNIIDSLKEEFVSRIDGSDPQTKALLTGFLIGVLDDLNHRGFFDKPCICVSGVIIQDGMLYNPNEYYIAERKPMRTLA
jgi:hypothetical protein